MKRTHLFLLILGLAPVTINAQLTPEERIQDSVIGWWNNNRFDRYIKPTNDPVQKRRIQICDSIVSWVKKSYTPVGGLGTFTRINNKNWYGVTFEVWNVSHDKIWTDEKGRFKPISEENTPFGLLLNVLPAVEPIDFLNHFDEYYFTWEPDGYMTEQTANRRKGYDFKNNPNVNRYITRITNNQNCVILTANNKPPYVQVTIGEMLDRAEASIAKEKIKEKETVDRTFSGTSERDKKSRSEAWAYKEKQFELVLNRINKWRQVNKNKLNEPAAFRASHDRVLLGFNDDNIDPFSVREIELERKQYKIVYKIPKEIIEKCKTNQPQWVTAWWPFHGSTSGNQQYEMNTAMLESINYEYIYNYFFSPEKVKGKYYKPANEDQLKARLNAYRKKGMETASITNTSTSPNVLLADDFSKNAEGTNAKGWKMSTSGEHSTITTLKNETGKWLKLGYNNIVSPFTLKKPLPQNFSVNFDVATDEFSSRTGGAVVLYMSTYPLLASGAENKAKDGAWLKLTIRAGNENDLNNNNYSGEAKLELHSNPPLFRENFNEGAFYTKSLTEFTNKKRKVQVQLRFYTGEIHLFINNIKVAVSGKDMKLAYGSNCKDCKVSEGLLFNTISWENLTNNAKETGVYISNIKVTKE